MFFTVAFFDLLVFQAELSLSLAARQIRSLLISTTLFRMYTCLPFLSYSTIFIADYEFKAKAYSLPQSNSMLPLADEAALCFLIAQICTSSLNHQFCDFTIYLPIKPSALSKAYEWLFFHGFEMLSSVARLLTSIIFRKTATFVNILICCCQEKTLLFFWHTVVMNFHQSIVFQ